MSASQARLLMLTARKSDLEYQAQQICQQKLALAQQEEEIAVKYNNAISNTEYKLYDWEGNTRIEIPMTLAAIQELGYILYDENDQPISEQTHPEEWKAMQKDAGGAESYIKYMMENHGWLLRHPPEEDSKTLGMTVDFVEAYDHSDDAAAEAEYNLATKKIQSKEKQLDLTMEQIETQHEAVKNEMESVEKVVKDNVEKTFKTFA